jgi:hypothetical protein
MNCHPSNLDKTVDPDSCLTKDVLLQLKSSYNHNHPDTRINAFNPTEIWSEMQKRLRLCKKEDCWLNEITDPTVRTRLDKDLFAPDHPSEWKKSPNTWLTNFDIMHVLRQYEDAYPEFTLIGPTPIDFDTQAHDVAGRCVWKDLCDLDINEQIKRGKRKFGVVFNLDKHNEPGSHWVSIYVDLDNAFIFYMDSAGNAVPREIEVLAQRIIQQGGELTPPIDIRFHENYPTVHQFGNNECGMYTLYFIITMLTNKTDTKTFKTYLDKIGFFKRKRISDKYVFNLRKLYFNS